MGHWLRGRILFIADVDTLGDRLIPVVQSCLEGGVRMIQLRGKNLADQELYRLALTLRQITVAAGALLFINDRLDIAMAVEADGVHLGQHDLPLQVARPLLPNKILGKTCRNAEQAEEAQRQGADYVGLGAIFPSPTKPSAPVIGLETLKQVRTAVSLPICAIGGIHAENLADVLLAGADFVALISAISEADEPGKAAALLMRLCEALSSQG